MILLRTVDDESGVFVSRKQILFILLQNRQGKTRLAVYYIPLEDSEKHKLEFEVLHSLFSCLFPFGPKTKRK